MAVIEGRTWLELLSPAGCDRHLRTEEIGRIALTVDDDHPEIFPVNYAVDDRGDVSFRTDPGTKLHAVDKAPMIAMEIDGIDDERHLGWSVLVVGEARHLGLPDEIVKARAHPDGEES
jgi:nitroimidazol reductase NimA-like FMN-containing flavoprotein (pyridoxamine 5'-phosphate oxidase superfamily)